MGDRARMTRLGGRRLAPAAVLLAVLAAGPAWPAPQEPPAPTGPTTVLACDNLVTLRRLMGQDAMAQGTTVQEAEQAEPLPPPDRTGCREVAPEAVGAVERRTLIGGAPIECRSIEGGPCLWVRP